MSVLTTTPPRIRVVRHASGTGAWEAVFASPDPRVRELVHGQYVGWVERTNGVMRRKEVPFPGIPLIFNFGPAFRLLDPADPAGPGAFRRSFVAGLHDIFALTESPGDSYCLQVNLTPIGGYLVLGTPMRHLANRVVELEDLLGRRIRSFVDRLADTPDWEARFTLVDRFLTDRAMAGPAASPGVLWAWRRLVESAGNTSIVALGRELGVSHRHLIAQFREQIGLPPKLVARIVRFSHAVALLKRDNGSRWSRIAHECGYHDQAHLNRDFREFAGASPSDYVGRLLPDGGGVAAG